RLTDRHKTIPYFKRVLVSSDTWGRSSRVYAKRLRLGGRHEDLQPRTSCPVSTPGGDDRCAGDIGYQLTRIRSTLQHLSLRIAAIEHVAEHRDCVIAGSGYVLCEAVNDYRVAFIFPAVPTKPVRDLLTRCGFMFDPRRSHDGHATWSRKHTPTAIMAAQRLVQELNALMASPAPATSPDRTAILRHRPMHEATLMCEVAV
ncbi:hypothetical protein WT83_29955, partial [Burkholderia territorii]